MAQSQFSYERLHVHADIQQFHTTTEEHVAAWDQVHAVVDQFNRASEGVLVSLAEASRAFEATKGYQFHESLGLALTQDVPGAV